MFNIITQGLVLHLEAIVGVIVQNGVVVGWEDQSDSENDLNQVSGNPVLAINSTPTGQASIQFDGGSDGSDDGLGRFAGLVGLPDGASDRTMFLVVRYEDVDSFAGASYGNDRANEAFGLISSNRNGGDLYVQGWGSGNDFDSNVPAVGSGWIVHSVVLRDNHLSVYRNGVLIDTADHVFETVVESLLLGENLRGGASNQMSIAATLIYDRALTVEERLETEAYLQTTYIGDDGIDDAPVAADDTFDAVSLGTTVLDILDNDYDDGAALDASSIVITNAPDHGIIVAIDPVTGAVQYQSTDNAAIDSFSYQVADAAGNLSDPTLVVLSLAVEDVYDLGGFTDEIVSDASDGLVQPISIAFLPDNRLLVVEKAGTVRIVDPESGSSAVYMQLPNINSGNERGLLDITLDPDFETNGHFYLFYTPASPQGAVIARFTHQENGGGLTSTASAASEVILWQDTDGYSSCCHYGGGLDFGVDGKLWLTSSDKFDTSVPGEGGGASPDDLPIDLTSTSGKIIRINKDGSIPDGTDGWPPNPYITTDADPNGDIPDSIWAYGLRNPFRARWDLETGNFYIAEVGGNQNGLSAESIHIASLDQPGVFYGWPFYEGTDDTLVNANNEAARLLLPQPDGDLGDPANGDFYSSPIFSYPRNGGASITGGEVYRGTQFPDAWDGVYFYGDYSRGFIRYLILDEDGTTVLGDYAFKPTADLPGSASNIVYVGVGNDGALYYINYGASGAELHRISYDSGNSAPSIDAISVVPDTAVSDFDFDFTATVSDPENDALTYIWTFGDGTQATGTPDANGQIVVEHTFGAEGFYTVSLSVNDGSLTTFSSPIVVEAGDPNAPPVISGFAVDDEFVEALEAVNFSATATDSDGDALTYTWTFGDGNTETGTVGPSGVINTAHAYSADGTYNSTLTVSDGQSTVSSSVITISVGDTIGVPIVDGLVLSLESYIKVGLQGDQVTNWLDGSGLGNNLTATGDPRYVLDATPSGAAAIVFDGDGDSLFRLASASTPVTGLPTGSGARTMFFVVKYEDPDGVFAGAVYGDNRPDEAFGLALHGTTDRLMIQAWGGANDDQSDVLGVSEGWLVQSVVLQADGSYIHYLNGVQIDAGSNDFNTVIERLVIGENLGGNGQSAMSVGAVMAYDRALNETERMEVEAYLQQTYITPPSGDAPIATDDTYSTNQDETLVIAAPTGLLSNDSDPNGDALTVVEINGVPVNAGDTVNLSNGDLVINADGSFSYIPDPGYAGPEAFAYTVSDPSGATDTGSVSIQINSVSSNNPPIGLDDSYSVSAGESLVVNALTGLLANDTDPDGDAIIVSGINGAPVGNGDTFNLANGDLQINADGTFIFTPDAGFTGTQSFTYTVSDTSGATDTASVSVEVTPVVGGSAPIAVDDAYQATSNTALNISAAIGILGNDSDPDGDPIAVTQINGASVSNGDVVSLANGVLTISTNGSFSFTSSAGFTGVQSFTYVVGDGVDGSDTGSVDITVTAPPMSGNLLINGSFENPVVNPNSYQNYTSVEGWTAIAGGRIEIWRSHRNIDATDGDNFLELDYVNGQDGFFQDVVTESGQTYTLTFDTRLREATNPDSQTVEVLWNGVLVATFSPSTLDWTEVSVSVTGTGAADRLTIREPGTNLANDGVGALLDNFVLTADGGGPINTPPIANNDAYNVDADQVITVAALQGLLANDGDPDGDPLTISAINGAAFVSGSNVALANGDLVVNADGSLSYTPDAGYVGADTFTYTIQDGQGGSATATATVTVDAVTVGGSAPNAVADSYQTVQDQSVSVTSTFGLLANDTDADSDPISLTQINGNTVSNGQTIGLANGDLVINLDGSFTYTPDAGFSGTETFFYTVSDGVDGSSTASVSINVTTGTGPDGIPVTSGLVVALEADQNVALIGGSSTVDGWLDGSGFGNDLISLGDPQLVLGATPTGEAAIVFDGDGDVLQRLGGTNLSTLPSGNEDRTVFLVVDYVDATRTVGAVFGDGARNEAFGLVADGRTDRLGVQGWGSRNDQITSTQSGNNDGVDEWLVQSAVLEGGQLTQFLNGVLIGTTTHTFNTDISSATSRLVIGEEIAELGFGNLAVSAFLVFDRALSDAERALVEAYLLEKYVTTPSAASEVASFKVPVMETQPIDSDIIVQDKTPVSEPQAVDSNPVAKTLIMEVADADPDLTSAVPFAFDHFEFAGIGVNPLSGEATISELSPDLFFEGRFEETEALNGQFAMMFTEYDLTEPWYESDTLLPTLELYIHVDQDIWFLLA